MWTAPRLTAPPRTGRFGPAQVVAAELIAILLVAAVHVPVGSLLPVAVAALLAPAVLRWRGRWWYEVVQARLRLRHGALVPPIHTLTDEGVGIGLDEEGWFAAMAVAPANTNAGRTSARAPCLDSLVRHAGDRISVQVLVQHSTAATDVDPMSLCARSYQELRSALGVAPVAVWIVLRLASRDARAGAARDVSAGRQLRSALARVGTGLNSQGLRHRVLDGPELGATLRRSRIGPDHAGTPAATPHESWRRWRTGRFAHVSFGATRWPTRVPPDLLTELGRVGHGIEVWISMVLAEVRAPDRPRGPSGMRLVVRIVAPVERIGDAARRLRAHARALGVSLVRLDGEQGPAVYATAPTAAPYGWGRSW
jgi:type VII secretion protein EccE